jgi:acetyl-CoA carboxylase, biotin carboxylase subunit
VKTTIPFHIKMMDDPNFRNGKTFTTSYLDTYDFSKI